MDLNFLKDIPSLENSILSIKKLEEFNWPKFSEFESKNIEEFKKIIFSILDEEFKIQRSALKPHKCRDFNIKFFRVRELSSFSNLDIFSEHSYPPIKLTKMGRCNFPENPVFYCSNDPATSLMELIRQDNYKNKKYCISRWKVIPSDDILFFENFFRSKVPEENFFKELNSNLYEQLNELFEGKITDSQLKGTIKYFEFLDRCFIDDENYSLSASLAHESLYRKYEIRTDILAYPSKQTNSKGINFAINPNFVNNNMNVDRFYIVEVNNISEQKNKYNISFHKYGNVINRVINWHQITNIDKQLNDFIKTDFGKPFFESLTLNKI